MNLHKGRRAMVRALNYLRKQAGLAPMTDDEAIVASPQTVWAEMESLAKKGFHLDPGWDGETAHEPFYRHAQRPPVQRQAAARCRAAAAHRWWMLN